MTGALLTCAGASIGGERESAFYERVFLWTGSGLFASLSAALLTARYEPLRDLMWHTSPFVPLVVTVAQIVMVAALCAWWKRIPNGAARLAGVALALLLGMLLSGAVNGWQALAAQVLLASSCTFLGAGLTGLAAGHARGLVRPLLAMAATGLLAAVLIASWMHTTVPYVTLAVVTLLVVYDLVWARRLDRLAGAANVPAFWGTIALVVGLVELLLLLLDALGRIVVGMAVGDYCD